MVWEAIIPAALGLLGGEEGSDAAEKAAKQQEEMALLGMQAQQQQTRRANRMLQPFYEPGLEAQNMLNFLMGFGSPTQMAKTEANFDPEAYRNSMVAQKRAMLEQKYGDDPARLERKLAKEVAKLDQNIEKFGAWRHYNRQMNQGKLPSDLNAFRQREGQFAPTGGNNDYGFLMRRFSNAEFEKDPGYQFRMDEGARAVEGGAAARGGLLSGAAAKAMQRYGQGFASNEYGNAYNRFVADQSNLYGRLTGMSDTGMRAAGAQGGNLINMGQQVNQSLGNIGDVRAAGTVGSANARASGYRQFGNALMQGADMWGAASQAQNRQNYNNYRYGSDGMQLDMR